MRCLIDTHALIWWWDKSERLPAPVRDVIADRRNDIFVSAATAWEIATKVRAGRLPSMADHVANFDRDVRADGFQHLDVRYPHGLSGGMLDGDHRDPFDRLIAAQALAEDLIVITRDREIAAFGCRTIW